MKIKLAFLLSSFFLISTAQAQSDDEKNYMEAVVLRAYYKESGFNFYHGMGGIRFGHKFDKNFSVEGLAATALATPSGYIGSVYVTAKVSNAFGVYAKVQSDPSNGYSVYGKAGATNGTVTASAYVSGIRRLHGHLELVLPMEGVCKLTQLKISMLELITCLTTVKMA